MIWKTGWWKSLKKRVKRKKEFKNEESLRNLCNNIKYTNIHITGGLQKKTEKNRKTIWRNNDWKFPNLQKETNIQVQGALSPK